MSVLPPSTALAAARSDARAVACFDPGACWRAWLVRACLAAAGIGVVGASSLAQVPPAGPAGSVAILPPAPPWDGASRKLVVPADDPWITPCEASGLERTPRYDDTIAWLRRLSDAAPELEMVSLGRSPEGRDIWMVVATHAGTFTPEALRASGKPLLCVQAGIHAGEIDGKDAGMMLLRDLSVRGTQRALLDGASFLFVPILNVDGHERFSAFSRINQRGPVECGWRTTARHLNLNRDYTKADAPETRAMLRALDTWAPDLYVDVHVTDGIDNQYDITFGYNGAHGHSPAIAAWLDGELAPALRRDLQAMGHIPGSLVFAVDGRDLSRGIFNWTAGPRFSNGYGDARHLPTVLVENHSLKSYSQRVLGTSVFLASALRTLGARGGELRAAVATDRARRPAEVVLDWKPPDSPPPPIEFLGVESRVVPSAISGGSRVEWTGKPVRLSVPCITASEPAARVRRPRAYWVPGIWSEVIERLAVHGIHMQRLEAQREVDVEVYRIADARLDSAAYEGRARVHARLELEKRRQTFSAGSVRVPTDQALGDLAVLLLEPESDDSFFQWGFVLEALQPSEYVEDYIMEPMAEKMLAESAELRQAFAAKLASDPKFAADSEARLRWFYRQTPFFDTEGQIYPVARE